MKRIRPILDIALCICVTMLLVTLPFSGALLAMVETRGVELVRQSNQQLRTPYKMHKTAHK